MRRGRPRWGGCSRGASVLETLVTLVLGLFLVHLLLDTAVAARQAVSALVARSDRLAAVRVARVVLGTDGRHAGGTLQLSPGGSSDSVALRVVRGAVLGCGGADSLWTGLVEGFRGPDPTKDSVVVSDAGGARTVHGLVDVREAGHRCPGGLPGRPLTLVLDPPPGPDPMVGRYFERGSYHLSGRSLRYRRGSGGRQPLTATVVATPPSGFVREGEAVLMRLFFPPVAPPGGEGHAGEGHQPVPWVLPVGPVGSVAGG